MSLEDIKLTPKQQDRNKDRIVFLMPSKGRENIKRVKQISNGLEKTILDNANVIECDDIFRAGQTTYLENRTGRPDLKCTFVIPNLEVGNLQKAFDSMMSSGAIENNGINDRMTYQQKAIAYISESLKALSTMGKLKGRLVKPRFIFLPELNEETSPEDISKMIGRRIKEDSKAKDANIQPEITI